MLSKLLVPFHPIEQCSLEDIEGCWDAHRKTDNHDNRQDKTSVILSSSGWPIYEWGGLGLEILMLTSETSERT